jgi:acyl-CoA synthetase (AMP-forming)/AMP-acid ligase II
VALLGRNRPSFLDATMACLRMGVVPVPLDIHLPAHVVGDRLADADPSLVLVHPELEGLAAGDRPVEVMADDWPRAARQADLARWPATRPMHYTSGTTGASKGVYAGVLGPQGGRGIAEEERAVWGFTADDVHLVCGPLYHSGPHRFAVNTLLYGGRVVGLDRFDATTALDAIAQHGVTTTFAVPTHLSRLLATRGGVPGTFRWVAHAGAPCPVALKHRAMDAFGRDTVYEFYGSTEGQFTVIAPDEWLQRPGSVGRARAGRQLAILDGEGVPVAEGVVGTIYTSAPPFARFEYWRDPQRTARAWHEGRFTVGDLGSVDEEGYLWLAGRSGDLIITGGVNVYPAEVERVFLRHPNVFEVAVFGVADDDWGERVCAAVVAVPGSALDAAELHAWVRGQLAAAQRPKEIIVADDLPRTGSGKVRRSDLGQLRG